MNTILFHTLNGIAIIATAVVFGTNVFFAVVGKPAAAKSKESSIADLVGHFHEIADARMPFFGVGGVVATLIQVILAGPDNITGLLTGLSLAALLAHLFIYFAIAKPINTVMVEGVKYGRVLDNIRQLQQRWDKVIGLRAWLLLIAISGLIIVNYL